MLIFYIFAVLLVYFSFKSFRGGVNYLKYFKRELAKPASDFTPFATVIAPCKGLDEQLTENLQAVLNQNYPAYEVIFVVDDRNDPAVKVIEEISSEGTKMVVAPRAVVSGQKVENLREAVLHADESSEVFVFVDSDVRPGKAWLRSLVAPLADENVGAATGYRWFLSERTNFATEMRSAWNASIASALGPSRESNFCWGGSTAIRRKVFDRLDTRERWRGTLSDDFAITRVLRDADLPIHFVPRAVVPSFGRCSTAHLFEFTNRQMKITRVYAPKLWLMSFFGSALFNGVMICATLILIFSQPLTFLWLAALVTLTAVAVFSIGKSWLRFAAMRLVIPSDVLDRQFAYQVTLWLLTPGVFLINCTAALFSTSIIWRGTRYKMVSSITTIVDRTYGRKRGG